MKLLVFSDSHGSLASMKRVSSMHKDAAHILFLGDGVRDAEALAEMFPEASVLIVRGNCDFYAEDYPTERTLTVENHKILMTHGHTYGVKSGYGALLRHADNAGATVVLSGHTHLPEQRYFPDGETPRYLMNPGSIRENRYGIIFIEESGVFLSLAELPIKTAKGELE